MSELRLVASLLLISALSACGKVADLAPPTGQALPQKPALAKATPNAEDLLALPPQAKPQRVDELQKRGEARKPDPFDLPPPTGVESDPQASATAVDDKEPNRP